MADPTADAPRITWHSSRRAISIGVNRRPIIDVIYNGAMPAIPEYEESFVEFVNITSDGRPVLWLIDMQRFSPLDVDAKTRKGASEVFFRYQRDLVPVSIAEARVTRSKMTRYVLTAFDWLTGANKWPCQQFDTTAEAERWLWARHKASAPRDP